MAQDCHTESAVAPVACPNSTPGVPIRRPSGSERTACSNGSNDNLGLKPRWLVKERGWRRLIQNFIPAWFAVTMGTGIVSILLRTLPYQTNWLHPLSNAVFVLNICLFVAILAASIIRYTLYPATWALMIQHPVQSLFLGTAPMGFATIINEFVAVCVPMWGEGAATAAWVMWWIDVVASLACCFGLPFMMMSRHRHTLSAMTAVWLLPIVAPIVASASGAVVSSALIEYNPNHALITTITSYILLGTGLPLALIVLTIYFHRLTLHQLPPREAIVSVFLPLGPLGQGGFSIMKLGTMAAAIFGRTGTLGGAAAGQTLEVLGVLVALVLWGFGLCWLAFALAAIAADRFPFNMGWWGFTFPLGVFAMSTLTLGQELTGDEGYWGGFGVLGTILAGAVILLYVVVAARTAKRTWTGEIFVAPCIQALEKTCLKERKEDAEGERNV